MLSVRQDELMLSARELRYESINADLIYGLPRQTPESFAATIYSALGIGKAVMWQDAESRPHPVYHGEPIRGLMS